MIQAVTQFAMGRVPCPLWALISFCNSAHKSRYLPFLEPLPDSANSPALTLLPSGSSPELSPLSLSVTRSLHLRSMSVAPKPSSAEGVNSIGKTAGYRTAQEGQLWPQPPKPAVTVVHECCSSASGVPTCPPGEPKSTQVTPPNTVPRGLAIPAPVLLLSCLARSFPRAGLGLLRGA